MSIRLLENQVQDNQQSTNDWWGATEWIGRKISDTMPQIARNLNKVAVPLVVLAGMSQLSGADAGPVAYGACVAACGTFTIAATGAILPISAGICVKACWAAFLAPGP